MQRFDCDAAPLHGAGVTDDERPGCIEDIDLEDSGELVATRAVTTRIGFSTQRAVALPQVRHSATNLYPTPGSVRKYRGRVGFASSFRRSCMM